MDDGLASGIQPEQTRAAFHTIELIPPREVEVWFAWQNGARRFEGRSVWLLPLFEAWSVEAVLWAYAWRPHGSEEWEWHPRWVQITGEKYGLAVWFPADPGETPLVRVDLQEGGMQPGTPPTQVVSLCTVVAWWIDGLRTGRYVWDRETWTWTWTWNTVPASDLDPRDATQLY